MRQSTVAPAEHISTPLLSMHICQLSRVRRSWTSVRAPDRRAAPALSLSLSPSVVPKAGEGAFAAPAPAPAPDAAPVPVPCVVASPPATLLSRLRAWLTCCLQDLRRSPFFTDASPPLLAKAASLLLLPALPLSASLSLSEP
jgi:hypothetical protein